MKLGITMIIHNKDDIQFALNSHVFWDTLEDYFVNVVLKHPSLVSEFPKCGLLFFNLQSLRRYLEMFPDFKIKIKNVQMFNISENFKDTKRIDHNLESLFSIFF